MENRQPTIPLIALLLAALIVRLAWGLFQTGEPDHRLGDQYEYLQLGRNFVADRQLRFFDDRFDQWVYAYRTPGYPLLIAACGGSVRVVRIAQAVIDTSTVLAVYLLARRFLSSRGGLIAALLVAVNPLLVYFSALVLSETLFTALLAWGMYGLVRQERSGLAQGVGHVLLALAVLVRPSAMVLPIALAVVAVWPAGWRQILTNAVVAGGCVLIVLLPWAWRNAHHPEVRAWVWTTTNGGVTTYDGFHAGATGASDQKAFIESFRPLLSRMDELERDSWLSEKAHEWIQAHPGESLRLMIVKIGRTWSPVPLSNEYGGRWIYLVAGVGFGVPFFLLILLGLWKGALPRPAKVFLLLPAIYFTGIHALSVGSLRYRIPVEPPMAVLAGSGALALSTLHGPSRRKS